MTQTIFTQHAIRSWARRQSDTWLHADEAALQAWLADSAEHREAYEKVARAWDLAGELRAFPLSEQPAEPLQPHERRSRSITRNLALAACVVVLTIAGLTSFWSGARHSPDIHLVTLKGQPRSFVLDDGTRVLLDADSELVAQIGHNRRRITLVRGEAQFNVFHDASRPFEVIAGSGRVQDLGTHFDVETWSDSTRVCVLEGQVAVSTEHGRTLLAAGQAGGYDKAGNLDLVSSFDPTTPPWLEGLRHFDHARLGDVLERLARHHAVTFVFEEPRLRDLRVSGTFKTDNLEIFLRTLAAALPIEPKYLAQDRIEIAPRSPRSNGNFRSNGSVGDLR